MKEFYNIESKLLDPEITPPKNKIKDIFGSGKQIRLKKKVIQVTNPIEQIANDLTPISRLTDFVSFSNNQKESNPMKSDHKMIIQANIEQRKSYSTEISYRIDHTVDKFSPKYIKDVDLVVGLHAHGCNIQILEACRDFKKDFLLVPCCVIDEPINKKTGIRWTESLFAYAESFSLHPKRVDFNIIGRSVGLYSTNFCYYNNDIIYPKGLLKEKDL